MSKNTKNQCTGLTKAGSRCKRNGKYEVMYNDNKYNLCGIHNKSFNKSIDNFKFYIDMEEYTRQNHIPEEGLECSISDNNTQPLDVEGIKKLIIDNNSIYSDSDNEDNDEIEQDPNNKSEYIRSNFYEDGQESNYDIINCVKIKTINGKTLYLDKSTYKIYEEDTDDSDDDMDISQGFTLYGIEIGELTRVSDKKAPIVYKGHYYIASSEEEIKYKRKMYKCCALTDKCYQLGNYGIYDYFGNGYRNNRGRYTIKPYISE